MLSRAPASQTHRSLRPLADTQSSAYLLVVLTTQSSKNMADDENKTEEAVPDQEAAVEDKEPTSESKDDTTAAAEESKDKEKPEEPATDMTRTDAEESEKKESTDAPAEEIKQDEKPIETDNVDEDTPIPENEAIPEKDVTPAVEVAEHMSREGTPTEETQTDAATAGGEHPDATVTPPPAEHTPEPQEGEDEQPAYIDSYVDQQMFDEEEEYYDDSEPEEPMYNRQELIEKYHQALEERSSLQSLNAQLQHKLAEYFKKKKSDERHQEIEKSVTDQEQRYLKYMSNLEELQNEEKRERESYKLQIEDLKAKCQDREEAVTQSSAQFTKFKLDVAKEAINSRSGKPIPPKDIEQYEMVENKKEQEVTQVRLENIKLRNRLKKREMQLKAKEELAEGLHLIDFEQLKIENQTYNEKIEERNEELLKLRKKITTTVQVLTHLKEKLQFVQAENADQRNNLRSVEALVAQKRDILTRTKQVRDALRIENVKLRQKCGLLGNESLLKDYELRKEQSDDLTSTIEQLKMAHAELTMNCAGVKKKIDQARQEQQ